MLRLITWSYNLEGEIGAKSFSDVERHFHESGTDLMFGRPCGMRDQCECVADFGGVSV